ncbi:MAG: hypothetical protein WCK89_01105 [bacterium]
MNIIKMVKSTRGAVKRSAFGLAAVAVLGMGVESAQAAGFRYYKWSVTAANSGGNDYQVSEIAFYSSGTNPTGGIRVAPVTAIGDGGSFGDAGVPGLYDNNLSTKSYMPGGWPRWVTFDFGSPQAFTGYDWATANDVTPGRNPAAWTVSGSDDNANWTVLDTQTGQGATPTATTTWASGWPLGPLAPAANMTTFGPGAAINQSARTIAWAVPYGTAVTNLAPTYTLSAGAVCDKASGSTNDFTSPLHYIVRSSDSLLTNNYTVTVTVTPASSAKDILTFGLPGLPAVIAGTNIVWSVPYGTDLTNLAPAYTVSPFATGSPATGVAPNFSVNNPAPYTITAQNGSTQFYAVAVTVLPDWPTLINVNYYGGPKPGNADMDGVYSYDVAARGGASRVAPSLYNGAKWNDFNSSVASGSDLLDSKGNATGVGFATHMTAGPWNDWTGLGGARMLVSGVICGYADWTSILELTHLDPTHKYDLYIAGQVHSGSETYSYRIWAEIKSKTNAGATDWTEGKNYVKFAGVIPDPARSNIVVEAKSVCVNGFQLQDMGLRTLNPEALIATFTFPVWGSAAIDQGGKAISISLPYGTPVNPLSPTLTHSVGASVSPASGDPVNLTTPQTYRVVSEDLSTTNDYTVTVTILPPTPAVTFVTTSLDVSAAGAGAEILNTGRLIAANHIGAGAVAPVTLNNGLLFGISLAHLTSGSWGNGGQATDSGSNVPNVTDPNFGPLMRSYRWTSALTMYVDIPGLTPGRTYRLQMISVNPENANVVVEGNARSVPRTWSGGNAVLSATWTQLAGDTVANVVVSRNGGEVKFNGYALHDITVPGGTLIMIR